MRRALKSGLELTKTASGRSRAIVANAASIPPLVLAARTRICSPMERAAASASRTVVSVILALFGSTSSAMRAAAGTSSRRSSSRFAVNSPDGCGIDSGRVVILPNTVALNRVPPRPSKLRDRPRRVLAFGKASAVIGSGVHTRLGAALVRYRDNSRGQENVSTNRRCADKHSQYQESLTPDKGL